MIPRLPKYKKPTVGFQARFFGNGCVPCKLLGNNGLRDSPPRKTGETRLYNVIFLARRAGFSAKEGRFLVIFDFPAISIVANGSP
jgi:hypothetical protein